MFLDDVSHPIYLVLGCLHGSVLTDYSLYLGGQRRFPLQPLIDPSGVDQLFVDLQWAVTKKRPEGEMPPGLYLTQDLAPHQHQSRGTPVARAGSAPHLRPRASGPRYPSGWPLPPTSVWRRYFNQLPFVCGDIKRMPWSAPPQTNFLLRGWRRNRWCYTSTYPPPLDGPPEQFKWSLCTTQATYS